MSQARSLGLGEQKMAEYVCRQVFLEVDAKGRRALIDSQSALIESQKELVAYLKRHQALQQIVTKADQLEIRFFLETIRVEVTAQLNKNLNLTDALMEAHVGKTSTSEGVAFDTVIESWRGDYAKRDIVKAIEGFRRFHQHYHQFSKVIDLWISSNALTEHEKLGLLALADIVGGKINIQDPSMPQ